MRTFTTIISALALTVSMASPAVAAVSLIDPVPAANPGQVLLSGMQSTCDAAAALNGTNVDGADKWTGVVVLGDVKLVSGPAETGTHSKADAIGAVTGGGTFTPAHLEILGDPYRNGGSVNMFGMQQSVGGHYSLAIYDFMGTYKTTYAHAFSCAIYKATYHPAVHHDAVYHPAVGVYVVAGDFGESEDAVRGNCAAFTQQGEDPNNLPDWWGDAYHGGNANKPHCKFVGTAAYTDPAYDDPAYYDTPVQQGSNLPQTAVDVDQTDVLKSHEDADLAGLDTSATLLIGQVVVCISPSKSGTKLPGSWTKQNGYTGAKCTTEWYNGGATAGVPNLNDGSHNWVTVPLS